MVSIHTINEILNDIDKDSNGKHYANLFTNYRLSTELKNLCLNSYARDLSNIVNKEDPTEVFSVYFHGRYQNNKKKVETISITSNRKQNMIDQKLNILIIFLQKNSEKNLTPEVIQSFFDHIVYETDSLTKKQSKKCTKLAEYLRLKNLGNFELFNSSNELNDEFNKNFNLLLFLQDLVLVFISKDFYDFGEKYEIIYKNVKKMHSECVLATDNKIVSNEYIGISKLCCPFCQKFLHLLGFRFRGGHKRYYNSLNNWRIPEHTDLNQQHITAIHDWIILIQKNLFTNDSLYSLDIFNSNFQFDLTHFYGENDDADDIQLLYDSYNKLEKNSVVELMHNLHKTFLESEN